MNQYDGMFLFDPTFATEFANVEQEVKRLMERIDGEIVLMRKWDERKLAYDIAKRKRGCYVLVYFKAPVSNITALERDARLSEHVLRLLVLKAEGLSAERMEHWASRQVSGDEDLEIGGSPSFRRPPRRQPRETATAGAPSGGGEGQKPLDKTRGGDSRSD